MPDIMKNDKPNLRGLPNYEAFYNVLSNDNAQGHLEMFFRELKEFPYYDEDFKVFDQYVRTYKDRLSIFMDFYNDLSDETLFIEEELSKLSSLLCFHLKLDWNPELSEFDIIEEINKLTIISVENEEEELFLKEYTRIVIDILEYLNEEQLKIFNHLNKLKELMAKRANPLELDVDIENSEAPQESYVDFRMTELKESKTYRLKVLERAGILKFLHDEFTPSNHKSYAKLLDKILNVEGGDTERMIRDYFANIDPSKTNKSDFRTSDRDYDEIETFLDKHFSKRPKNK